MHNIIKLTVQKIMLYKSTSCYRQHSLHCNCIVLQKILEGFNQIMLEDWQDDCSDVEKLEQEY
jgi:membrane-anchored protein YejM (alkaline phosphatase superfamily)